MRNRHSSIGVRLNQSRVVIAIPRDRILHSQSTIVVDVDVDADAVAVECSVHSSKK